VYRKLISDHLREWGFTVTLAETGAEAAAVLDHPDSPKLVLLDWMLPDIEGVELCERIRKAGLLCPYIYVILLSSKDAHQDMLQALQAGADDYLAKPFDEAELKARLMAGNRVLDLQEDLLQARESMRHAATHDSLTQLLNRGEIFEMLHRELERSQRDRKRVGVILADVDHFKEVNDTLGHLFGDRVLREVACRLRSSLRGYDGIGRYGGEEFLLVLPGCDLADAVIRADELRQRIAREPVAALGANKAVTVSMGVAVSDGGSDEEMEALLGRADEALYRAKRNGRNRVEFTDNAAQQPDTSGNKKRASSPNFRLANASSRDSSAL
jgi:diguanylate cyclase (GGDEF)-like protein